jgi:16S rRNA (cytosine967-C5)-methyltransferase
MVAVARQVALQTLRSVHAQGVDLAAALDRGRRTLADDRDRSLAADIAIGTLRWRGALDHTIAWAGNRSIERFDAVVLDILRITAYQLLHLDRVPASAAVDDAVELCRLQGHPRATGAVNAILRRISRDRSRVPMPGPDDPIGHLSVTWSHPSWLAARWLDRLGFDTALAWARFNNAPAPVTLRANTLSITRAELADSLDRLGVRTRRCTYAPDGLLVDTGHPLSMPVASEGAFLAQDEASQLVGAFAAPRPGDRVLDACAAPGGKTAQFAAAVGERGFLVAGDLRLRRMRLLRDTLTAARVARVAIVRHNALEGLPYADVFDSVVIDAPCSSLGTIRRDPDIRWTRREEELAGLADRQVRMLDRASRSVRPGGCLVYATCSSEPEENEEVVEAFLAAHGEFVLEDPRTARTPVPPGVEACLDDRGCLRTTPHQHGLESFFAARLRRRA